MRIAYSSPSILGVLCLGLLQGLPLTSFSQEPDPVLIGYWHNWNNLNAPYIPLDQIDPRYDIVDVAFALPKAGTDHDMVFVPEQVSPSVFASQVKALQAKGRKVLISVGGATATVKLDNAAERDVFVASMLQILDAYGFDGIDIDLEGSSLFLTGGSIAAPTDPSIVHLVEAIRQIMASFQSSTGRRLMLTMAPETAFVQGGQSAYAGIWGAYLPVIHALRDSIEILHVQLYNSGTMYGIDGKIYTQGTADFILAMCEAVIQGFPTAGGYFGGLPASRIAVGLPACPLAAGGGYTDTATVRAAIDHLRGMGPQPGSYTLKEPNGYPDFRGMMTWSINWDATASCGGSYTYAQHFDDLFGDPISLLADQDASPPILLFPNPANEVLHLRFPSHGAPFHAVTVHDALGRTLHTQAFPGDATTMDVSSLPAGTYLLRVEGSVKPFLIQR